VPLVWVDPSTVTVKTGAAIGAVTTATEIQGASGEFRVNDTTAGNQMYPAVAMSDNGDAVVTWTSYGQPRSTESDPLYELQMSGLIAPNVTFPEDSPTQGNIFAKTFSLPVATSNFHITLVNLSGMTAEEISLANEAAHRWEAVIVGALPPATLLDGTVTDGLVIDLSGVILANGALGQAAPDQFRPGPTGLPSHATITISISDMQDMLINGTLLDVITHEMAHCLGFGGNLWQALVTGLGSNNPQFIGKNTVAAYHQLYVLGLSGFPSVDPSAASGVPVEAMGGGGTAGAHWSASVFPNELMCGWGGPGLPAPMSTVTVASMADLGYTVSYDHIQNNSSEFLVNTVDLSTAIIDNEFGDQSHSSVAMDANGDFVIAGTVMGRTAAAASLAPATAEKTAFLPAATRRAA